MIRPAIIAAWLSLLVADAIPATPGDAAKAAANGPSCSAQAPFYWEIGDSMNVVASGSVGGNGRRLRGGAVTRDTVLSIASASKWPYGAYVEKTRTVSADDTKFLNFQSGWTSFQQCQPNDTVGSCAARAGYVKSHDGFFWYSGGHDQKHAAINGLDKLNAAQLGKAINDTLGTAFTYTSPQLAGGMATSAAVYADFLRKLMKGSTDLKAYAVPTSGKGTHSPVPDPTWKYGLSHWIEPDGTTSSPGAFGFYPYITGDKRYYGIVARQAAGGAWSSVQCGRAIRQAFLGAN